MIVHSNSRSIKFISFVIRLLWTGIIIKSIFFSFDFDLVDHTNYIPINFRVNWKLVPRVSISSVFGVRNRKCWFCSTEICSKKNTKSHTAGIKFVTVRLLENLKIEWTLRMKLIKRKVEWTVSPIRIDTSTRLYTQRRRAHTETRYDRANLSTHIH